MTPECTHTIAKLIKHVSALESLTIVMAQRLGDMTITDLALAEQLAALAKNVYTLRDNQIDRLRADAEKIADGPERQRLLSLISSKLEQPKDQADAELSKVAETLKKLSTDARAKAEEFQKFCLQNQLPPAPS